MSQKLVLSDNKLQRLQRIIVEAVEQSGRYRIPELLIEDDLSLDSLKGHENIFCHHL
jgi:16S rRNA U1498 N3-methylase RsmE